MSRKIQFGKLPRVVGTISSRTALEAFSAERRGLCDIVEVRMDEIGTYSGWTKACAEIESSGVPVMVTLRSVNDGGKCDRDNEGRLKILRKALKCASIVDVEFKSGLGEAIGAEVQVAGKQLLVSYHDFSGTPSVDVLENVIATASKYAAIVKLATMVKSEEDLETLHTVVSKKRNIALCVIGMGAKGTPTRTTYPCLGSCLTYGYLDFPSAPGQLSARNLVAHLRSVLSSYNEEFIIRNESMEFV